jgi:hypothetical protein
VANRNRGGGISCLVFLAFLGSRGGCGGRAGLLSVLLLRLRLGSLGERRGRHAVFGIGNGRVRRHGRRLMNGS